MDQDIKLKLALHIKFIAVAKKVSALEIVDALIGVAWDEEEAGSIKDVLRKTGSTN